MIAVAIIGVLAAVAIPAYQAYLRRSAISEAQSGLAQIKPAMEAYYALTRDYISAAPNPAGAAAPTNRAAWDPAIVGWGPNALNTRPDRFVRFQYQVWATTAAPSATGDCGAGGLCDATAANSRIEAFQATASGDRCFSGAVAASASGVFVETSFQGTDWFVIGARANLNSSSDPWSSLFLPVDETRIFECNLGD